MNGQRPLRIALLTHSTNPRGGVVHAMELGDALHAMGQHATVLAPDPGGRGLFRATRCCYQPVPARPASADLKALVRQRIDDFLAWLDAPGTARYDIYHAQDSISANALAELTERGVLRGFVRTVHHLDHFDDAQLATWQRRGYQDASTVLCVSRLWQQSLAREHGVSATLVGNGVNTNRYAPPSAATADRDNALRERLQLGGGPAYLCVGGVEPRKNTLAILQAYLQVRSVQPDARLLVAGGASLLDHSGYARQFDAMRQAAGLPPGALQVLGRVEDEDMPSLYRCAEALVFASVREGFGLAVLEAMASGTPAIVSRMAPFTEYLPEDACIWTNPGDPASIADAMLQACEPHRAARLRQTGLALAARHTWSASAARHLQIYQSLLTSTGAQHA